MAQKNESDGELSREMQLAWQFVEQTGTSVFLTGKAGTGKTTFLRYVKEHTSKTCVVTAPTGVAAINARGVTLHSFFQLPPTLFVPGATVKSNFRFSRNKLRIIRALDLLIIDEISMVRSDLLDAVDDTLRRLRRNPQPFGGVQLLMIGDLQQLAPVVTARDEELMQHYYSTPYFFGSRALAKSTTSRWASQRSSGSKTANLCRCSIMSATGVLPATICVGSVLFPARLRARTGSGLHKAHHP